jgi:hypothetical protein
LAFSNCCRSRVRFLPRVLIDGNGLVDIDWAQRAMGGLRLLFSFGHMHLSSLFSNPRQGRLQMVREFVYLEGGSLVLVVPERDILT